MKHLSLRLDLLDQQLIDAEERPVGRVDEIELEVDDHGVLVVTHVRMGAAALGPRVGGWIGALMRRTSTRLA